jgi:hypothetical protein
MIDEKTNIAGVFLNSEEALRLWFAMKALDELVILTENLDLSSVCEFPRCTLELINTEPQFVVGAGRDSVFEFQSGDDDRLKHLEKQKARLEAAVKALKGVPSVH